MNGRHGSCDDVVNGRGDNQKAAVQGRVDSRNDGSWDPDNAKENSFERHRSEFNDIS